jgi:hypothetical protein
MTKAIFKWRNLLPVAIGLSFVVALSPTGAMALDEFKSTIDKRTTTERGARTRTIIGGSANQFQTMATKKKVLVDLKVLLDGKTRYEVMSSEEQDERRYNVDCSPGAYGRLPMGDGIEYYVKTGDESGRRIDLSIYPGSRSTYADNDISCVADPARPKSAVLRIRGIYRVLTNDFGDRLVVELRPLRRDDLTAAERKTLN